MKRSTSVVAIPMSSNQTIMRTNNVSPETSLFSSSMAVFVSFRESARNLRSLYTLT
ncbi:hypothetical protein HanIR_Chr12g0561551 [Helianthus annuus]|nr:hypothetical protein HanIR_Chr12g0561551 [Helianthus annuus]